MRYVIAIGALILVVGMLVLVKFTQISMLIGFGEAAQKSGPPPQAVATAPAQEQRWEGTLSAVGTVASMKGVTISNEVAGTVSKITFEPGALVKKGDMLVELDASVERAQVASAQVRRDLALVNATRARTLAKEGLIPQLQLDADESQLRAASAEIDVLNAQIRRKSVRAPFAGRIGIDDVNLGQYLSPGTPLTTLEAVEGAYIDFTLPQQQKVEVGMKVRVAVAGAPELSSEGAVVAIDPAVDAASRSMKLRASVPNKGEKLRPGMFADVTLLLPDSGSVVIIASTAVVHASFGDSVFILETPEGGIDAKAPNGEPVKIARQQFVRLGERRGDFVAVREGVKAGDEVVIAGAFKLRNKAPVFVNNALVASPELEPRPENH